MSVSVANIITGILLFSVFMFLLIYWKNVIYDMMFRDWDFNINKKRPTQFDAYGASFFWLFLQMALAVALIIIHQALVISSSA